MKRERRAKGELELYQESKVHMFDHVLLFKQRNPSNLCLSFEKVGRLTNMKELVCTIGKLFTETFDKSTKFR